LDKGLIIIDGHTYALPNTSIEALGDYPLKFTISGWDGDFPYTFPIRWNMYTFSNWECDGDVSVENTYAASTTLTIGGTGSLTAIYTAGCPIGEQLTNGDFETGDFTGWTLGPGTHNIVTTGFHGIVPKHGTYFTEHDGTGWSIEQDLPTAMLGICVTLASLWWTTDTECPDAELKITLTYDDESTESITQTFEALVTVWQEFDFSSYIDEDKYLVSIKIERVTGGLIFLDYIRIVGS